MHLLAQLVDAAIAEDRAAKQRLRLVQIVACAERVRLDAFVPVAADVRDVAVLGRSDDELELSKFQLRRASRSVSAGAIATPSALVRPFHAMLLSRRTIDTSAPPPARRCPGA